MTVINEIEALLGILIVIIIIYFFLWRRSKLVGSLALLLSSFALLVPFGGTDYELIAWIGIGASLTGLIAEFAFAKAGATQS